MNWGYLEGGLLAADGETAFTRRRSRVKKPGLVKTMGGAQYYNNSVTIGVITQARKVAPCVCGQYSVWFCLWRWERTARGEKKKSGARRFEEETTNDQRRLQTAKELWFSFWLAYWQRQTPSDWMFKSHSRSKWSKARHVAWVFITATKERLFPLRGAGDENVTTCAGLNYKRATLK